MRETLRIVQNVDPLSSVLSLIKIQNAWSGKFRWGQNWCLRFGAHAGIHSYAVLQGECWLAVEGVKGPVYGKAGDSLLLTSGLPFRVGSDLTLPALDVAAILSGDADASVLESYAGDEFVGIGGKFTLDQESASLLTGVLPPILHIRDEKDKMLLRWTLERLADELEEAYLGGDLVVQQLSTMLLVQALRVHLAAGAGAGASPSWLYALADRRMRAAIAAMHHNPGQRWTLELLARTVGMSRTSFTIRFKQLVGKAPLDYLTHWRMLVAVGKLKNSEDSLSAIARSIGYESQSSFSTAFRRTMKVSPRQYANKYMVAV